MRYLLLTSALLLGGCGWFHERVPHPPGINDPPPTIVGDYHGLPVNPLTIWGASPDPDTKFDIDGITVEGNFEEGYVFEGTCIRAMWMEIGDEKILADTTTKVGGVEYIYNAQKERWSLYKDPVPKAIRIKAEKEGMKEAHDTAKRIEKVLDEALEKE